MLGGVTEGGIYWKRPLFDCLSLPPALSRSFSKKLPQIHLNFGDGEGSFSISSLRIMSKLPFAASAFW